MEMEAGCWLIEYIERISGVALGELARELYPLCLPPDSVVAFWPSVI